METKTGKTKKQQLGCTYTPQQARREKRNIQIREFSRFQSFKFKLTSLYAFKCEV